MLLLLLLPGAAAIIRAHTGTTVEKVKPKWFYWLPVVAHSELAEKRVHERSALRKGTRVFSVGLDLTRVAAQLAAC
jgi:hypothetical protein